MLISTLHSFKLILVVWYFVAVNDDVCIEYCTPSLYVYILAASMFMWMHVRMTECCKDIHIYNLFYNWGILHGTYVGFCVYNEDAIRLSSIN